MKTQALLLFLAAFGSSAAADAATVSGTVLHSGTGNPISAQTVTVMDMAMSFMLSATTNSSGYYSITLPSSLTTGTQLTVQASGCGTAVAYYNTYAGTSFTSNLFMCGSSPRLNGTVWLGANIANTGPAKVWFIQKKYDPVVMDTTLTAIDSVTTSSTGAYSKAFASMPAGAMLIKAALLPSHPDYANYLPTYSQASFIWTGAQPVTSSSFTSAYAVNDIIMRSGANTGGSGFIGGSVLLGANKGTAVGDPLGSRILLLTTASGQTTAYTYSDGNGKFQFPNLPYDTYKIFGDALGKNNPPLVITLSATNKTVSNVVFEESSKKFEGHLKTTAVVGVSGQRASFSVYPNPATDVLHVEGLGTVSSIKSLTLLNAVGAVVSTQLTSESTAAIQMASLPAGTYVLRISTESGVAVYHIVK